MSESVHEADLLGNSPRTHEASGINVPSRPSQDNTSFYGSSTGNSSTHNLFVGSPDQLNPNTLRRLDVTSSSNFAFQSGVETTPPRVRPSLGNRSVSTPHPPLTARRASTTSQRGTSTLLGSNHRGHVHRDHQWSLFGQLMENEGQLRSPGGETSGRRRNHTKVRSDPDPELDPEESLTPRPIANDPFATPGVPSPDLEEALNAFNANLSSEPQSRVDSRESSADDEEYDSDTSVSRTSSPISTATSQAPVPWYSLSHLPTVPLLYRNIFKCAVAYFIASLFTFSPYLSGLVSDLTSYGSGKRTPSPSGHMVATVAVYFNPAKTMGGMVEADLYCMLGLLYSSFVCLSSMSMFWWLETKPGWEWLADVLVIAWIGVSMCAVAWMKVWMASPSFNTACSMTAIILFVVLVKEGGLQTLLQVSFIVLCGSITSNLVCYLIWPQSATSNLQTNMTKTLDSFSTLLNMLTNTFLLEEGLHHPSQEKMQRAVADHQNSFTSLKKDLGEAKSEWFYGGPGSRARDGAGNNWGGVRGNGILGSDEAGEGGSGSGASQAAYEDTVDSLTRLAQHLNGLRSGTRLQYELTKAGVVGGRKKRASKAGGSGKHRAVEVEVEDEETAMLKAAAVMFGDLVDDLGPPLKALSTTCTFSIKRLRESFVQSRAQRRRKKDAIQPHEFLELVEGIERALVRFESTSNHAVLRLYRRSDVNPPISRAESMASFHASASASMRTSTYSTRGENTVLTSGDHEHVFLVYFFIFTLQEFARESVSLVDAMGRVYSLEQERVHRAPWWKRAWRCFWARLKSTGVRTSRGVGERKRPNLRRSLSYIIPETHHRHTHTAPYFPKVRPHAPNTIQTPPREVLTFIGRVKQSLWAIGERFGERDMKYAVKAGMATAILAAPAFFDATRPIFVEYWGDWALISFFIVISPTIGATNYLSLHRVLGTLFGAAVAAGIYTLFPDNAIILSIFGFFFSLPCFYYIVAKPQYVSASRFVLLTYNLTCLYCYNLRRADVSALDVAFHRAIAVTVGVVWAALVSRFWWPSEARRELGRALSEFCLNMGWLYTRLVASNSFASEYREDENQDPASGEEGASLLIKHTRLTNSIQEFMAMELHLQIKLIELQGLLAQTQHEPRLKGPFPVQLYRGVLTSLQTILDKLHSMRCVTTREEWYTNVRQDFIIPVNRERHEMVGNIILSFSTLASAFRLKAPLPPYLPPAEKSRQRLVDAIRRLDIVRNRDAKGSRQLLFFAYALTMKGVTQELESLGRTLQNAFGVIGQTPEEFEALFMDPAESRRRIDHAA